MSISRVLGTWQQGMPVCKTRHDSLGVLQGIVSVIDSDIVIDSANDPVDIGSSRQISRRMSNATDADRSLAGKSVLRVNLPAYVDSKRLYLAASPYLVHINGISGSHSTVRQYRIEKGDTDVYELIEVGSEFVPYEFSIVAAYDDPVFRFDRICYDQSKHTIFRIFFDHISNHQVIRIANITPGSVVTQLKAINFNTHITVKRGILGIDSDSSSTSETFNLCDMKRNMTMPFFVYPMVENVDLLGSDPIYTDDKRVYYRDDFAEGSLIKSVQKTGIGNVVVLRNESIDYYCCSGDIRRTEISPNMKIYLDLTGEKAILIGQNWKNGMDVVNFSNGRRIKITMFQKENTAWAIKGKDLIRWDLNSPSKYFELFVAYETPGGHYEADLIYLQTLPNEFTRYTDHMSSKKGGISLLYGKTGYCLLDTISRSILRVRESSDLWFTSNCFEFSPNDKYLAIICRSSKQITIFDIGSQITQDVCILQAVGQYQNFLFSDDSASLLINDAASEAMLIYDMKRRCMITKVRHGLPRALMLKYAIKNNRLACMFKFETAKPLMYVYQSYFTEQLMNHEKTLQSHDDQPRLIQILGLYFSGTFRHKHKVWNNSIAIEPTGEHWHSSEGKGILKEILSRQFDTPAIDTDAPSYAAVRTEYEVCMIPGSEKSIALLKSLEHHIKASDLTWPTLTLMHQWHTLCKSVMRPAFIINAIFAMFYVIYLYVSGIVLLACLTFATMLACVMDIDSRVLVGLNAIVYGNSLLTRGGELGSLFTGLSMAYVMAKVAVLAAGMPRGLEHVEMLMGYLMNRTVTNYDYFSWITTAGSLIYRVLDAFIHFAERSKNSDSEAYVEDTYWSSFWNLMWRINNISLVVSTAFCVQSVGTYWITKYCKSPEDLKALIISIVYHVSLELHTYCRRWSKIFPPFPAPYNKNTHLIFILPVNYPEVKSLDNHDQLMPKTQSKTVNMLSEEANSLNTSVANIKNLVGRLSENSQAHIADTADLVDRRLAQIEARLQRLKVEQQLIDTRNLNSIQDKINSMRDSRQAESVMRTPEPYLDRQIIKNSEAVDVSDPQSVPASSMRRQLPTINHEISSHDDESDSRDASSYSDIV